MLYRKITFVYSEIQKIKFNLWAECNNFNVALGGAFRNQWTLES